MRLKASGGVVGDEVQTVTVYYKVLGTLSNDDIDLAVFAHGSSYGPEGRGNKAPLGVCIKGEYSSPVDARQNFAG